MSKFVTFLMVVLVLGFALSLSAQAQQSIGGHDESTEDHTVTPPWAAAALATAGVVNPAVAGSHVLMTEIGVRGWNGAGTLNDSTEFIEIYNPTSNTIDLSKYYLSDVNGYKALPVAGNVDVAQSSTDFACKFPAGATIAPGGVKVVATDGGRYKRNTGVDADYMLFNLGGVTSSVLMVDVGTNKPTPYPTFGMLTNGGEFVWLFFWDGMSDLVCDVDFVYWGSPTGGNIPLRKLVTDCQDGPDADALPSCYNNDAGNPAGNLGKALVLPASGAGTRQRVTAEGAETLAGGNGCVPPGGPIDVRSSTWGQIKALYR